MKSFLTKTYTLPILFLCLSIKGFGLNITIMESQSFHPAQTMDIQWYNTALNLGYSADIKEYAFLNDKCNLKNTDILIISSGLISLSSLQLNNIEAFVAHGGQLYLQSEYLLSHPGNIAFKSIVQNLGGAFSWNGQGSGQQVPMVVKSPINNNYNSADFLNYFWYGTYGTGDETITPFFEYQGKK